MPIDKHIKWAIWVNMINIQTHREWFPTCFYNPPDTLHTVSSRQQNTEVDIFWRSTPGILVRIKLSSIMFLLQIFESPLSWRTTPGRIRRRVWYDTTIPLPDLEGTKTNREEQKLLYRCSDWCSIAQWKHPSSLGPFGRSKFLNAPGLEGPYDEPISFGLRWTRWAGGNSNWNHLDIWI